MGEGPPIMIIGMALILVALALPALRNRGKLKQPIVRNKKSSLKTLTLSSFIRLKPIHPFVASQPHYVVQAKAALSN